MKNYDPEKPSKHIVYLDAVNLYGWGMIQNLPYEGFQWIEPEEFKTENVRNNSKKAIY